MRRTGRYLPVAFGARPHMAVRWNAPMREFERIAGDHPVFRVDRVSPASPARRVSPG